MKFSRDHWILLFLALCLMAAMLVTLLVGGSRSRHGYGNLNPRTPFVVASQSQGDSAAKSWNDNTIPNKRRTPALKS